MREFKALTAPIGGWNTVDSIADMDPTQAYVLDNLIPGIGSVYLRNGYSEYATSVGAGNVDSLFELKGGGVNKMIAAASGNIYDVSTSGVADLLKSGFSSNQWEGAVFNAQLGLVNGTDTPQVYDGTTVSNMTVSGPTTVSQLTSITTFKNRTYFTLAGSQSFWYSALNTLGGVLTQFPLGKVGNFGGDLIAIRAITKDGGDGQDDNICFFMSTGEIIGYRGTDPSSDFVLIGVYNTGRPIGPRSIQKYGPDIFVVNTEGYLTLSSLLPLSYGKSNADLNKYIKGAASASVAAFSPEFGWQMIISPTNSLLIVNVPQSNNMFVQHVLNVNTMRWCRFTGINSRCWCNFGNNLYFGGVNGTIYRYGPSYLDDGESITAVYQSPYLSLGKGQFRSSAFRPNMRIDADMDLTIQSSFDFKVMSLPYTISYTSIGARWGDEWGSTWARSTSINSYLNLNNVGYKVSISLSMETSGELDFYETYFLFMSSNRI
jgi:hypothetical protein